MPNNGLLHNVILRDEAYDYLRKNIISHTFPPGYRFELKKLEQELGISRTPLKLALHRLESEGLVKIKPRRGTYVTPLNPANVAESFDVRAMLETAAAPIVIAQATDHEIAQLGIMIKQMRKLLENKAFPDNVPQYIDLDHALHRQFMSYARNKELLRIYARLNTHLQIARVRTRFSRANTDATQGEHELIQTAVEARDVTALQDAIASHLSASKARALAAIREADE